MYFAPYTLKPRCGPANTLDENLESDTGVVKNSKKNITRKFLNPLFWHKLEYLIKRKMIAGSESKSVGPM